VKSCTLVISVSTFAQTTNPTPYGFFDSDPVFQFEADASFTWVRRRLGDDVVTVELTKKQVWGALEESFLEYARLVGQNQITSQMASLLGIAQAFSGSIVNGTISSSFSVTGLYPQTSFDFLMRQADGYAAYAGLGGVYDTYLTYIPLVTGQQDYNLYTDMIRGTGNQSGSAFFSTVPSASLDSKIRVYEVFHFEPLAAQHYLLNASNITNFLATEFNYESYVNTTVFYVLPVYEDVLRRGMLETAHRVRRSHYSYKIQGRNIRVFPTPSNANQLAGQSSTLWLRVGLNFDNYSSINPAFAPYGYGTGVATAGKIATPGQVPITIVPPAAINEVGRQWVRQYTLALAKEILGRVRGKFKTIPIPGNDLTLDADSLIQEGRDEQEKLKTSFLEWLQSLTYDQVMEREAGKAESLARFMKFVPMPLGSAIRTG
jgi:hypothetical protein